MLEYVKIYEQNEEIELQLSNKYKYSIIKNKLIKENKEFNTENFFSSKIENLIALVGANGSGKTSLIYTINDILSGQISRDSNLKYIIIIKTEDVMKIKTYNIDIEFPVEFMEFEKDEVKKYFSKAIYHIGVDGNNIKNKNTINTIDLSLNYKFQNTNSDYKVFKEETVFNQLSVISQHPELLNKIGIQDLNHPKEVSYALNLEYLNNTLYKKYSNRYLVYIYESDYIDFYYELDKLIIENKDELEFDVDWLVGLFEKKLILCNGEELKILSTITKKLKIKINSINLTEIFESYSRATINEVNVLMNSIESNNHTVWNFLIDIGTYYFENVFLEFFKYVINYFDIYSIINEKIFNETFVIDNEGFFEDIFQTIGDLNFIFKHFRNEEYIENLMVNGKESFYYKALELYFDNDIDDDDIDEEVKIYKDRLFSNLISINKDIIISQLSFINGQEPLKIKFELNINSFFKLIEKILLAILRKNINFDGFLFEDYLLDLGLNHEPKFLLKNDNNKYSKMILKDMIVSISNNITANINKIYITQKKSIEDLILLMKYSTPTENKSLSINTNSKYISRFFEVYGTNFAECIFKFEWRNMSSGEFAILNLLSSINRINYYDDKKANLVLFIDEGDLYLHPQWQKQFLFILIKALEDLLDFKKIFLILTTHSPFLVSDLPKENLLFLNPVKDEDYIIENTFAANINELLATKFFIQDGLIGKFAKEKINKLYEEINNKFDYREINYYKDSIGIIGEPLVKAKLTDILNEKIYEQQYKETISEKLKKNNLEFDEDLLKEIYNKLVMEKVQDYEKD